MTDNVVDFETGAGAKPAPARLSIMESMKQDLAARKAAAAKTIELRHDAMPELTITCRVPGDGEEISDLSQRADKRAKGHGTGIVWFNRLILARFTIAIDWHGKRLQDADGTAFTFASRQVHELAGGFGNDDAVEVVEDPTTDR